MAVGLVHRYRGLAVLVRSYRFKKPCTLIISPSLP